MTIANSVYDGFGPVLLGVSGIMKMKCMVLNHDNASGEGLKDMLEKLKGYLRSGCWSACNQMLVEFSPV